MADQGRGTSRQWRARAGRWAPMAALVLLGAVVLAGLAGGRAPADRVEVLASQVRCPDCPGISVAESETPTARAIHTEIRQQVVAGRSDAEILDSFVARYGRWVLLEPPASGPTLLVWVLPGLALLLGVAMLLIVLGRRRRTGPATLTDAQRARVAAEQARLQDLPERPEASP